MAGKDAAKSGAKSRGRKTTRKAAGKRRARKAKATPVAALPSYATVHGPAWRYLLAKECVAAGIPPPVDAKLANIYQMLVENMAMLVNSGIDKSGESIIKYYEMCKKFPEIYPAFSLYSSQGINRFLMEAMLVAKLPVETVAARVGLHVSIVTAYKDYFFDIDEILESEVLVMSFLVGSTGDLAYNAEDKDKQWKAIAYFCSAATLKEFFATGKMSEVAIRELDNVVKGQLRRKAVGASLVLRADSYAAAELLRDHGETLNREYAQRVGDTNGLEAFTGVFGGVAAVVAAKEELVGVVAGHVSGMSCRDNPLLPDSAACAIISGRLTQNSAVAAKE